MNTRRVLVVEDDSAIRQGIADALKFAGYEVLQAPNGNDGMTQGLRATFDLLLLDLILPGHSGFEILKAVREARPVLPIIILTARGEEDDRVRGLELGADDYVTKPFSPRELVSRVKAVLRRTETTPPAEKSTLAIDDRLSINFDRREVLVDGQPVKLRPTEFRLLYHLVNNAGWVVPHDQLLAKVWGYEYREETHYLRLYINYLRQKLEEDPANPRYILTRHGSGYELGE